MTLHDRSHTGPLCLAAVAAVVAACAFVLAPEAAPAPVAASCKAHDVVVWLEDRGDAGAGSVYYTIGLTNFSGRSCSLRGYPGVSAIDLAQHRLGSPAGRNPRNPVRTVRIAAGGSARFLLQLHDPGFFPKASCRPATAAGLRVYLPDSFTSSIVPVPFRACARVGPAFLQVLAVTS
jgi:hypothetical protein